MASDAGSTGRASVVYTDQAADSVVRGFESPRGLPQFMICVPFIHRNLTQWLPWQGDHESGTIRSGRIDSAEGPTERPEKRTFEKLPCSLKTSISDLQTPPIVQLLE